MNEQATGKQVTVSTDMVTLFVLAAVVGAGLTVGAGVALAFGGFLRGVIQALVG